MMGDHKEDSATPTAEEKHMTEDPQVEVVEEEKDATEVVDEQATSESQSTVLNEEQSTEQAMDELEEQLKRLTGEKEELYDRMLRIQAEYDNFKRRTTRERAADRKYKSQDLANELLPALDNFERALAVEETEENSSLIEGISMVYDQIKEALQSEGIEPIQTVGEEFDPNLHHAVMQVEDEDQPSNIIVEELQKGYILKDRVIRAAMVKVNK